MSHASPLWIIMWCSCLLRDARWKRCYSLHVVLFAPDGFCSRWEAVDVVGTCSCIKHRRSHFAAWNAKHTDADAHSSFSPLLSNLGHILCGRLGHTIPLGFEGIWRTSGPSLNLNIWITDRRVNTSLCLTFQIFWVGLTIELQEPAFFLSSVYSLPCAPLLICSSAAHASYSCQLYLLLSHSFKMYIHTELNITLMPLSCLPLAPIFSHT